MAAVLWVVSDVLLRPIGSIILRLMAVPLHLAAVAYHLAILGLGHEVVLLEQNRFPFKTQFRKLCF